MKPIVIVGATSAIATECARQWIARGEKSFVLIGRNREALDSLRSDLQTRAPDAQITVTCTDVNDNASISLAVDEAIKTGIPETVLIAQGVLPDQEETQINLSLLEETVRVNAIGPAMWLEAFALAMSGSSGIISVIGSVAGDRGRKSNYSYGASKAFLESFVSGMQHRFHNSKLNILLIKPGPVATPMTTGLGQGNTGFAPVSVVGRDIIHAIDRRKSVLYTPGKWKIIMFIVRNLPSVIFNRTNL